MVTYLRFFPLGITPAPAGKTNLLRLYSSVSRDHPRTCGENVLNPKEKPREIGSPPHLRGKPWCVSIHLPHFRITPAPAGKTDTCISFNKACEDHPRTCGENISVLETVERDIGSPPHLRGKQVFGSDVNVTVRITPAPAGKTKQRC